MAVSNLDTHALFVLGDLRAQLVKQFQSRFVYVTEQSAEGIYIAEIDTESAMVVDDKPRLELKVGDHFRASVLPSREGGKFEIKFREIKLTVYGLGDYAFVDTAEGHGIVFKEGHTVFMVFAAAEQLQSGMSKTLKTAVGKAAKWRKGELSFKASEYAGDCARHPPADSPSLRPPLTSAGTSSPAMRLRNSAVRASSSVVTGTVIASRTGISQA